MNGLYTIGFIRGFTKVNRGRKRCMNALAKAISVLRQWLMKEEAPRTLWRWRGFLVERYHPTFTFHLPVAMESRFWMMT